MKFSSTFIIGLIYLGMAGVLYCLGVIDLAVDTFIYNAYSPNDKGVAILITIWLSALFVFLTIAGIFELKQMNNRGVEI